MKTYFFSSALIVSVVLLLSYPFAFSEETSDTLLQRIETVYGTADDLTAEFVQKTSLEGFGERTARGTLYLKKDRMARWDYRTPTKQKIFVSGNRVVLYDPEAKRAVIQDVAGHPDAEPALGLLSRIDSWRTHYEVRLLPETAATPASRVSFELIPRKQNRIEKIRITADRETGLITRLTLHEKEGARVAFEFSGIRFNQGLKTDLFEFTIPRGVDILEVPR